tara:strand:- start:305 stop:1240 length:936 start_codon:yes stop_codon:yes gene_type:complete
MREKAQLSDRFRDFDANLTTRPWIVLGMGLRKFNRLLTLKTWNGLGIWLMIAIVYLLTFVRFILFIEPEDYPCVDLNDEYQRCIPLDFYGDLLGNAGGTKLFLIAIAATASGGIIGNDMANKSIHLYLSRPISRLDYLIARFIPVFILLLLVTALPNYMILSSMWSGNGLETSWLLDRKWLIVNIMLQGILYSGTYSIIGLTFSTLIKKEGIASSTFFLFVYGTSLVCETFFTILNAFDIDEADYILLLSINHVVDMLSYLIFDTKYYVIAFFTPWEVDIGSVELIAVFTVIFAGCAGFMYWMIQQMEANK